jgi:hypothetical protein
MTRKEAIEYWELFNSELENWLNAERTEEQ